MLHTVIAGNGNSEIDVETGFNVIITGDEDHFNQTFEMKYAESANTKMNDKPKNELHEGSFV